ncbi:MAG: thioredoxin domain-containing protein [Myxococcota bacterium]
MKPSVKPSNRLISETSPYLLQHAHNPVDWHPWGPEALQLAVKLDRPIVLSIGYSACHWCHVMEHESFESEAIAAIMNRHFVSIKVDREERPDLDQIYMRATTTLNHGQGGWPMTVFLTPDQKPFFAGTYFPPVDRYGRPGFGTLLERIADAWQHQREDLLHQAQTLTQHLQSSDADSQQRAMGAAEIEAAEQSLRAAFDHEHGGFGKAPKFPPSMALSLLLRVYWRDGDKKNLHMVTKTLDVMAAGGIYDHIGGGFARYSTDSRWLVPHFEKMLYDNALLAKLYFEAYQVTQNPDYFRVGREILDYVKRDMTAPEGGFYSATDADSEGVEGKFFVWTPEEIVTVLGGERAEIFCDYYDIRPGGNWEGKSIPNTKIPLGEFARKRSVDEGALREELENDRRSVFQARLQRVAPGLDDKILTSWNALMISAFVMGARLGGVDDLQCAKAAGDFVWQHMRRQDGQLLRTYRAGKAHIAAYLEDYAYLCNAYLDLFELTSDAADLDRATQLANTMQQRFVDPVSGAFFSTADDHERLIMRYREGQDGAIPNANAMAAQGLIRLSYYDHQSQRREAGERAICAYGSQIGRWGRAFCSTLTVVDLLLEAPLEIVLIGDGEQAEALKHALHREFVPNRVVVYSPVSVAEDEGTPLLRGKRLVRGQPAVYICRDSTCEAPVISVPDVAVAMTQGRRP